MPAPGAAILRTNNRHGYFALVFYLLLAVAALWLLIEFLRAKDDRVLGPFTIAQAPSVGLIVVGVYLLRRLKAPCGSPAPPARLVKETTPVIDHARAHTSLIR